MTIEELRSLWEKLKGEARQLNTDGKLDEAEAKIDEMREVQRKIDNLIALEDNERKNIISNGNEIGSNENVDEIRSFTKKVLHLDMTEEERAVVKTTDNAAVLPSQFINQLESYRDGFAPLKGDCDVIPVTTKSGSKPTYNADQNGKLKNIAEGDAIEDGSMVTSPISFEVKKVGIKVQLSSELVDDAEVEIEAAVKDTFAESAVMTENYNIIKVLDDNATAVTDATDYTAIENAMALSKPSVRNGLITYVNEAAYADIKNKKDKNGNNMNLITVGANGVEYFNNRPIKEFDSSFVTPSEGKKCVIFVANPKEAVKFFDRTNGVTADKWYDHDTQVNKLAVTERIDIKIGNKRSIKKIEY